MPTVSSGHHALTVPGFGTFTAYCMVDSGRGWTRVSRFTLSTSCVLNSANQINDPASGSCSKYSDGLINALASDKVFVPFVSGYSPSYTKYSDVISYNSAAGRLVQGTSYESVINANFIRRPGYGGVIFFGQQDWYQSDTCMGASSGYTRLSLEYLHSTSPLYACSGGCSGNCPGNVNGGQQVDVFIR